MRYGSNANIIWGDKMDDNIYNIICSLNNEDYNKICSIINYKYNEKDDIKGTGEIISFIEKNLKCNNCKKLKFEDKMNLYFIDVILMLLNVSESNEVVEKYNLNKTKINMIRNYIQSNDLSRNTCIEVVRKVPLIFDTQINALKESENIEKDLKKAIEVSIESIKKILEKEILSKEAKIGVGEVFSKNIYGATSEYSNIMSKKNLRLDGSKILNYFYPILMYNLTKSGVECFKVYKDKNKTLKLFEVLTVLYLNV